MPRWLCEGLRLLLVRVRRMLRDIGGAMLIRVAWNEESRLLLSLLRASLLRERASMLERRRYELLLLLLLLLMHRLQFVGRLMLLRKELRRCLIRCSRLSIPPGIL